MLWHLHLNNQTPILALWRYSDRNLLIVDNNPVIESQGGTLQILSKGDCVMILSVLSQRGTEKNRLKKV